MPTEKRAKPRAKRRQPRRRFEVGDLKRFVGKTLFEANHCKAGDVFSASGGEEVELTFENGEILIYVDLQGVVHVEVD